MGRMNWDATTVEQLKTLDTVYERAFEEQVNSINKEVGHKVLYTDWGSESLFLTQVSLDLGLRALNFGLAFPPHRRKTHFSRLVSVKLLEPSMS
jgi:hypothetical protein